MYFKPKGRREVGSRGKKRRVGSASSDALIYTLVRFQQRKAAEAALSALRAERLSARTTTFKNGQDQL